MAEVLSSLPDDRAERYAMLAEQVAAVVAGEPSRTARYATAACLLSQAFRPRFFWTGFYVVDPHRPNELVVGPYQGSLGCLRIPFGRGVCGAAAERRQTVLVPDVDAFDGHIACDAASRSEVVVPVFDRQGALAAVLDVDSTELEAFDAIDVAGLERVCAVVLTTP
ncbi:MAG: diguanylate phosphodiesterase [Deltaproteobacteria bacterium]|nr:diguanylate phosphodiesterase [Deltaproteobacteria bacterium]HCH63089.1 diguanylate phosphodiesterase [Deltaproteobacteria bacterium]